MKTITDRPPIDEVAPPTYTEMAQTLREAAQRWAACWQAAANGRGDFTMGQAENEQHYYTVAGEAAAFDQAAALLAAMIPAEGTPLPFPRTTWRVVCQRLRHEKSLAHRAGQTATTYAELWYAQAQEGMLKVCVEEWETVLLRERG